jgi:hypothetical protein
MKSHVKFLGVLQFTWGAIGLVLATSLLLLAAGAAAIVRTTPGDPWTAIFTSLLFVLFAVALGLDGWANMWVGRGLRQRRPAGRTGAFVVSVVNLFVLPFGTALAIYSYWVLLHNDARALFVE